MPPRRLNPQLLKKNRTYTTRELCELMQVHKNTIRVWMKDGLKPVDGIRPRLFHGDIVRAYIKRKNAKRKRPCPPGTFYCLSCRQPRPPALDIVEYLGGSSCAGNLRSMCPHCTTIMYRRARRGDLSAVMPNLEVRFLGDPND